MTETGRPSVALTMADIARLIEDPSPSVRAETATKVAQAYHLAEMSAKEREIANDIFRVLVRDAEIRVRQALSVALASSPDLPREVARRLAADVAVVAVPVLESAAVFSDADLIEIVRACSADHQAAIARRPQVSETVAEALVETGDETAVATLMENQGANVSEHAFQQALDRFSGSARVQEPMAHRAALPVAVAERLVTLVSESLREHLVTHHALSPDMAVDLLLESRERALVSLIAEDSDSRDVGLLVEGLHRNRRLSPSLIARVLCTGDLAFFEAAMARLANIPVTNARALIHDKGHLGLKALCEECRLPRELYSLLRVAVDVVAETQYDGGPDDRARFSDRVLQRVLTHYDGQMVPGEDLDWLIGRLGRAPRHAPEGIAAAE
jgi:uncharacterized protein (DUF2336 family)